MNLLEENASPVLDRFDPEQRFAMITEDAYPACSRLPEKTFSLVIMLWPYLPEADTQE